MARAKWRAFVDEYFKQNMNATRAYMIVYGVDDDNSAAASASRLLRNVKISELIAKKLDENSMQANEIISRLSDMGRGDMQDFIDIESMFFRIDLNKAKELGLTHLIKKVKDRVVMTSNQDGEETETHTLEIELYDAKSALDTLAKYRGLLVDRHELGGEITINVVRSDGIDGQSS